MDQQIRFCTSFDGARIAYALSGRGAPLVMSATWLGHLEHDWRNLAWRPWLEHFSRSHTLLRYDMRGTGLSDRSFSNVSGETWARDFEAVVAAAGFDRFPLLGICQGGPTAVEFAARHGERVSQLVLYGTYARGNFMRTERPRELVKAKLFIDMARLGWGVEDHEFMQVWASLFQPGGGIDHLRSWVELQRQAIGEENVPAFLEAAFRTDVQDAARRIKCPTLVIHASKEKAVHVEEGRRLAGLIPGARFVELESDNHMLLPEEPAWARLVEEVRAFLCEPGEQEEPAGIARRLAALTERERQVLEGIARGLDNAEIAAELALSQKTVRNHITRVFDKIGVAHRYQAIVLARDAGLGNGRRAAHP
ncbi:MAG TPA: alpha/beta fold hydrolase [Burkholderiales bacterium]|nr:alpha/beta fold hydrolase [Burkholderiales bacterium]